ncbi:MAG: dihydropyrimidinase [Marinovum sp.]|nr:dihydropyrimidinase [Marinovum sp.]
MTNSKYDTIIRSGMVVTASGVTKADIGIEAEKIAAIEQDIADEAAVEINASGLFVLPGGVDTHCHIEQVSGAGLMNSDTFESATRSAAYGGTTTVVSFAAQHPGYKMRQVVEDYAGLAEKGALIDYAFHMIVADTGDRNLADDIPALIAQGHRSIKIFTTYDKVRQDDEAILNILDVAKREGALVCFHAENDGLIRNMTAKLLAGGKTAPKYHAVSHPREAEIEAIDRMCRFAEFTNARIMIFHVSTREGAEIIRQARARGVQVQSETCPHYLFMTVDILNSENPARFLCSPPQRLAYDQEALWAAISDGTIELVTSDHAPYRLDASGKFAHGVDAPFNRIANGMPGLETRLPLMFNAMVSEGGLGIEAFARITATAPAQAFGLERKGKIAVGFDADIAIWDPERIHTYGPNDLHDNVGYNPFEGMTVKGAPTTVLSRGEIVVQDSLLHAEIGRGKWLKMVALTK